MDINSAKLQINHKIALQTSGLQERFNQTLERAHIKYASDRQTDWNLHVKRILFGYRTPTHARTGVAPFT